MKVLNLYAGLGGNRKLWGKDHDITAVENDEKIAKVYSDLFPNDKLVIGDAHCPAQVLRNCVHPSLGKYIFDHLLKK